MLGEAVSCVAEMSVINNRVATTFFPFEKKKKEFRIVDTEKQR